MTTARTIITEENGLKVVTRELLGKDAITELYIQNALVNILYPRYGHTQRSDLAAVVWSTVVQITGIILQTVSLEESGEARWPENLVLPDPSNYPACIAFYDILMESPKRYLSLLVKAMEAVNADIPNPIGAMDAPQSDNALKPDSLELTAK